MSWTDFYLICFIVGFTLSLLSVLGGFFHLHLPGVHHGHMAHGHAGHGAHSSVFNFPTITAFLAWFGGIGFLLSKFSGIWMWLAFCFAVLGGAVGGAIVFWFLFKVLLGRERPLNPLDYDMVGVLGRLTSGIREGGTGEIGFSQAGIRRSAPARSEDGGSIPRNADVLVTRYEKGIAYVRQWEDDFTDATEATDATDAKEKI